MRHGLVARLVTLSIAIALLAPVALGQEIYDRLKPTGYVNDFAGVIDQNDKAQLDTLLGELEQKTTAQVAVVTIQSLEGNEIKDLANRLFERWGVGKKGKDNGVLFLTAVQDRKVWIEVGYGLEPVITDSGAGRILDEYVMPSYRQGNYSAGITQGATRIASIIAENAGAQLTGAPMAERPVAPTTQEKGIGCLGIIIIIVLLILFIRHPFLLLLLLQGMGGGGGGRGGGGFGGGGGGGFGGFGGGSSGGGGAGRSW